MISTEIYFIYLFIFSCPKMNPGELTDLRSALVNNITLGCIAVKKKIHRFLLYQNYLLSDAIKRFVGYQESNNHEITDTIELLVSENDDSEAMATSIDVPKVLGDIFESIVGAVYLDSNMNLLKTWDVVYSLMDTDLHKLMNKVPKQIVRRLYEFPNAQPKFFDAEKIDEETVIVPLQFKCKYECTIVYGFGKNKEYARKAAAKLALQKLMQE